MPNYSTSRPRKAFSILVISLIVLAQLLIANAQSGNAQTAPSAYARSLASELPPPPAQAASPDRHQSFAANFFAYLPLLAQPSPSIQGVVTDKGVLAANVMLELIQVDVPVTNTTGMVISTTTTNAQGQYAFAGIPTLPPQKAYRVRYAAANNPSSAAHLSWFLTRVLNTYTAGQDVLLEDFDISDVILISPYKANQISEVELPANFTWTPRGIPSESYEFIVSSRGGQTVYFLSPSLGYVNSYQLAQTPDSYPASSSAIWRVQLKTKLGGEGLSGMTSRVDLASAACRPPLLINPSNGSTIPLQDTVLFPGPPQISYNSPTMTVRSQNPTPVFWDSREYFFIFSPNPVIVEDPFAPVSINGGTTGSLRQENSFNWKIHLEPSTTYYWRMREYCYRANQRIEVSLYSPASSFTTAP